MKKLINRAQACEKGNHDFMVSKWITKGTYNKSSEVMCRKCLLTVDVVQMEEARKDMESGQPQE